ncbi:unnamed protein product [Rotaria sordida]|uniref:EGF-like domain-containing protein n=1 Tax=Rotaria sordida TaxID=392033 RepID=A0A815URR9_9BILA|nr:unnamed protein product [Rotaria sordida]CAF1522754.1 unnamed protein product [Rotaria sordida]CAF4073139.1 unnamed protein product [Rotaria sordida]CAF4145835.1 unnamed protein product [Rotaria sordida]
MSDSTSTLSYEIPNQLIDDDTLIEDDSLIDVYYNDAWLCNRGLPIYIQTNVNKFKLSCLCSPSYYGDKCQYQNQRVSLSLQIRATSDWWNEFIFLIMLIDDEQNIESHDHIEYLSVRDCGIKFNVYLLYSTRPKNSSENCSVRIDAFDRMTMNYRSSWIYPIQFWFLPVYRLSILLTLPYTNAEPLQRCTPSCVHGQCFSYINNQTSMFCLCESGWSGTRCDMKYICDCAPNSLCIDKNICICPDGHFGPRCYLFQPSCPSNWCLNGGYCVPGDERYSSKRFEKRKCVCPQEYFGNRCEYRQTRIDISFHNELDIPQSLLVHFISVQDYENPIRTSTMKKIAFDQNSVRLYTSHSFNIAFAEMLGRFYLIILQATEIISANITTEIIPSHQCPSIYNLFNQTISNQHLIKRIKYYQLPCQKQPYLICFYDDIHLCLCDLNRRSNCFEFNHNMTYDCYGQNTCENEGRCFQNNPKCPTSSTCVCLECYYGSRCQFSVKGSTLSLDAILGYGIHPYISIHQQSFIVKFTISLTTAIFLLGLF